MPRTKVVILSAMNNPYAQVKQMVETVLSLAPPDLEVSLVENSLSDEAKVPLCREAEAIIVSPADISVNLVRQCPKLKLVQVLAAGSDRIDVKTIAEMGIPVAHVGGANAIATAEQTIGLMISVCKKLIIQWQTTVQKRRWQGDIAGMEMVEITDKTVGIVGLGRIGRQVAQRLKGFNTRTLYHDIVEVPLEVQRELNAQPASLEEILTQSDIVSLHVPLTVSTQGMIGEAALDIMKPSAYLINTSRGEVVDEKALYRALLNRRIAGAGLDVLEEEPTAPDNPLFELDNVVITPHMGAFSYEMVLRCADFAYSNIKRVVAGEAPDAVIDPVR